MSKLIHISDRPFPTHVPVPIGWPEELVTRQQLRNKYFTNRDIDTVGYWLLLKALTKSNQIQNWRGQKKYLLGWLKCSEKSFYSRLEEMIRLQLVEKVDKQCNIFLVSYEKAASALDITWCGNYPLTYNPNQNAGRKIFQYILRAEEIRSNQDHQFDTLHHKLEKNPQDKIQLHYLMVKAGADGQRLYKDRQYFQERLLLLSMQLFKEGSEHLKLVQDYRADINRSVATIAKHHCYKSKQTVSYKKFIMEKLGLISREKKSVRSSERSRLYVPDGKGGKRDAYKWIGRQKSTALFLTDQISFLYESMRRKKGRESAANAA